MAKTYPIIKAVSDQIKNATTAASNTAAIVGGNLGDILDKVQEVDLAKVPTTRKVNSKALSADIALDKTDMGLGNVDNTSDANKPVSDATNTLVTNHTTRTDNPHTVTKSQVGLGNVDNTSDADKPISNAVDSALDLKADLIDGKVPVGQLPAYVDDVLECTNFAAFPVTGESGKIYVALDTNLTYRWSGSAYTEISKSLALGETSTTAYRGDRGKIAYDHSQLTGNTHGATAAQIPNTPAGTIAATTVQAAINELDADRVQLETDLNQTKSDNSNYAINERQNSLVPAGFFWAGTTVNGNITTANTDWNSVILYFEPGITACYMKFTNYQSVYIFGTKPTLGMSTNLGAATVTTLPDGIKKVSVASNASGIYILMTIRVSLYPINTFYLVNNYKIKNDIVVIQNNVSTIQTDVNTIKSVVIDYSENNPFNVGIGVRLDISLFEDNLSGQPFTFNLKCSVGNDFSRYIIVIRDLSGTTLDTWTNLLINTEYTKIAPIGTHRMQIFENTYATQVNYFSFDYTTPSQLNKKLKAFEQELESSKNTSAISEEGSNIIQDTINLMSEKQGRLPVSNMSVPVVVFIYDDSYSQAYIDMFVERNLKLTFAIIGNTNKTSWDTTANLIRQLTASGHGTCAHGVVGGVTVVGSGVDQMNDSDVKIATEGENQAFDDYKLSHRGLVQYNTWVDNPHTWALMGRYYDYIVGFDDSNCINTPSERDLYQLKRMWTDNPNMVPAWKQKIDSAIATGDCVLVFGGHFTRTGTGGAYSTMAEFTQLLDYVAQKVNDGQLLTLNMDDAVDNIWRRSQQQNSINYVNYDFRNPMFGAIKYENGFKRCNNIGAKALYSLAISGTAVAGSFVLNLGNATKTIVTTTCQSITISTTAGEAISSVISKILSSIYKAYTVRKYNESTLYLYRDINGVTFTPYITDNISGLTLTISQIAEGVEATWV